MYAIQTKGLTKQYGSTLALSDLDLSVDQGKIFGFLGPNGAGKTTTIRLLLSLISPTSGTVSLFGHSLQDEGIASVLPRVGTVLGQPGFYPHLSGKANLELIANLVESSQDIDQALSQVNLLDARHKDFSDYSTGMKRRLALAAVFIKDPDLYLLDEPTNGLDPQGRIEIRNIISDLGERGKTIFLSTHLLNEVQQVCNTVGVLQQGKLIAKSRVKDLVDGENRVSITVRSEQVDKAKEILAGLGAVVSVHIEDSELKVTPKTDDNSVLVRALSRQDIDIEEIRNTEKSLEEVFVELTEKEDQNN